MVQIVRNILEHHAGSGRKSTALQPILILAGIIGVTMYGVVRAGAPAWMSAALLTLLICLAALFGWGYLYFMKTNPDALRSEKFNITKMAIERGVIGDKTLGRVLTSEEIRSLPLGSADEEAQ